MDRRHRLPGPPSPLCGSCLRLPRTGGAVRAGAMKWRGATAPASVWRWFGGRLGWGRWLGGGFPVATAVVWRDCARAARAATNRDTASFLNSDAVVSNPSPLPPPTPTSVSPVHAQERAPATLVQRHGSDSGRASLAKRRRVRHWPGRARRWPEVRAVRARCVRRNQSPSRAAEVWPWTSVLNSLVD